MGTPHCFQSTREVKRSSRVRCAPTPYPPPTPEELRLRTRDVTAVLDALEQGRLTGNAADLRTDRTAVVGHSWGGTTVLQLAGVDARDPRLVRLCNGFAHLSRNLSWFLQCSLLSSADGSFLADSRVAAIVAVSPAMGLLRDPTLERGGQVAPFFLINGTTDWVVPSGPEALTPFRRARAANVAHRLVLADGGDHFNLRAPDGQGGAALGGLILTWLETQLKIASHSGTPFGSIFPTDGWGIGTIPSST